MSADTGPAQPYSRPINSRACRFSHHPCSVGGGGYRREVMYGHLAESRGWVLANRLTAWTWVSLVRVRWVGLA